VLSSVITLPGRRQPLASAPPIGEGESLGDVFVDRVGRWPERTALRENVDGAWESISWADYGAAVREAAAGLVALGVAPGDRVGIMSGNQPPWHMADIATLRAGAVTVPVYPTSAASQAAYVLSHSASRICFVGDRDQLAKVLLARQHAPAVERLVLLNGSTEGLDDDVLLTFDDLRSLGRDELSRHPAVVDDRSGGLGPDSLATIVYTSGTTGRPKGVLITHRNISETIRSISAVVDVGPTDRFLSFLPLSHIAERAVSHFGQVLTGGETWFARGLATIADDLRACRPTIFFAVPRVWEKFQAAVLDELAGSPRPVRALTDRYIELGLARVGEGDGSNWDAPLTDKLTYLSLDHTVGARIRSGLGLDQGRIFVSAAAPINPELLRWFHAIGIPVGEVYGQTEDCGPTTINAPDRIRVGTVGERLPGVEVRIGDDGEILVRGPNVCAGYHEDPDATAALIDSDGWMHSGDLGRMDAYGYLHITGRKKDLIVTSSGKNIAPQDIETRLRADPLVSQAIVVGDRRSYLGALVSLDVESAADKLGENVRHVDLEALSGHPLVEAAMERAIERINAGHAPVERIRAWRVLPRELTVAGGELTPTLKVKRDVVIARFGDLVDEMYAPTVT
jgi:long-chain acyl-CoA synthetase